MVYLRYLDPEFKNKIVSHSCTRQPEALRFGGNENHRSQSDNMEWSPLHCTAVSSTQWSGIMRNFKFFFLARNLLLWGRWSIWDEDIELKLVFLYLYFVTPCLCAKVPYLEVHILQAMGQILWLCSLWAKNGFDISGWIKILLTRRNFCVCDLWKSHQNQNSLSPNELVLKLSHVHLFTHCLWPCLSYNSRAE